MKKDIYIFKESLFLLNYLVIIAQTKAVVLSLSA
jgi:hypothetical protein